jgi:hypothetical protein
VKSRAWYRQRGRDCWLVGLTRGETAQAAPGIYGDAMVLGWDECEAAMSLRSALALIDARL